ncbi:SpaA isopeptide-forming pilin-related protein, partial [Bacillus thuringiensis]|uniref:SpaA isopeptide-forming pilin-related protein n=1 Tax=Bacillus thuringiensis TaxID=1428 RepID=UPI003BFA720F
MPQKLTPQFQILKLHPQHKTKLLSHPQFQLYKHPKNLPQLKTHHTAKLISPKLPLPQYTLKQTKPPPHYNLSNKQCKVTIQN